MKTMCIVLFTVLLSFMTSAQKLSDVNCKLWKTASFCDNIEINFFPDSAFGTDCYWKEKTCEQMNKRKNLVGVVLTFNNEMNNTLEYKTNFENIKIQNKNNSYTNPVAIFYSPRLIKDGKIISDVKFITKFKAKKYVNFMKVGSKATIIMLFSNAETGDKLIIDNFIETEIQ